MCTSNVEGPLHLWLHSTLAHTRCWPGRPNFFKLEIGGWQETVSVYRLKPHLGLAAPVVSVAPPVRKRTLFQARLSGFLHMVSLVS
jgi:hypothetical protein